MGHVFLTGGSGFVGSRLLRALLQRGDSVVVLDRSGANQAGGGIPPSRVVSGDLLTPETYRDALASVEVVVHLAASTGRASSDVHWRTNALGTEVLLRECREAGVRRFLFVSSIAVTFPDLSGYWYAQSKARAEESVRASGVSYAVVRPTMVLGPGSPILAALSTLALLPFIPVFGNGRTQVQPVFVDDLVDVILAVLDRDLFSNRTFEVGGPTALPIEELLQLIRIGRTGRRGAVCHVPLGALLPGLRAAEALGLGRVLPVTVGQLATFRFPGTAPENALAVARRPATGLEAMVSLPSATVITSEALVAECRAFTRYLVASEPSKYIVDQYVKAHCVSPKFSPADSFDQYLVDFAVRRRLLAKLADSYGRVFAPASLLRRKLVLLLAILETAPPTYHVIDQPPGGNRIVLAGQLAGKSVLWLLGLVAATAFLFPARLAYGGRKIR